jgi:hypothetical protein
MRRFIQTVILASSLLGLAASFPSWASAQVDELDEPSPGCARARSLTESQAYLLVSPTLWIEGVHVPQVGDETGTGVIMRTAFGGEYQLRAALSWSLIDLIRGVLLLEQTSTECSMLDAGARVRRALEVGDALGELAGRREERRVLLDASGEIDGLVAGVEARVAAGLATLAQLTAVQGEAVRLRRRMAQLDGEIARLEEAGHDEIALDSLAADLALYEQSAYALEAERSTVRRLSPWTVSLRGGVVPGAQVDWFGQVQVGINLGVFAHHDAENAAVAARAAQLTEDTDELHAHARRFFERIRLGLPAQRDELGHLDTLIALQTQQRALLEGLETGETEHARTLIDLHLLALASERARLATLIATREHALETDLHADE